MKIPKQKKGGPDALSSLEGQLLVAMPSMSDRRFSRSVIYVCAHSDEGAMGLIVNQRANDNQGQQERCHNSPIALHKQRDEHKYQKQVQQNIPDISWREYRQYFLKSQSVKTTHEYIPLLI